MHKIIDTTDNKYKGKIIDVTLSEIDLDGFVFRPTDYRTSGTITVLSNSNYIILAKEE